MKKQFEKPEISLIEIESDVITLSGCVTGGGNDTPVVFDPN